MTPPTAPPPLAPPPLAPPPRQCLPLSLLPVWSAAPNRRLFPPPRPHLRPLPPPCSSAVAEPMDAGAAVTPPPPPMDVVALSPYLSTPSGSVRPGQVFHGAFSSHPHKRVDSTPWQFRCLPPQLHHPWALHLPSEAVLNDGALFQGGGMWY
ncbi:uncharacterized protein LOC126442094 [Schistocerca serialis cubense]|uniref:uncharacterized protein LOC126442094 n=1 Tax=Schistocerca serialis cubense TaxID=2023355 RepID=UPI00214E8B3B|nr:uncharacterized protein LOC126442094 [Schistocerca serialis cubense]